jgi:hypothetical protein
VKRGTRKRGRGRGERGKEGEGEGREDKREGNQVEVVWNVGVWHAVSKRVEDVRKAVSGVAIQAGCRRVGHSRPG